MNFIEIDKVLFIHYYLFFKFDEILTTYCFQNQYPYLHIILHAGPYACSMVMKRGKISFSFRDVSRVEAVTGKNPKIFFILKGGACILLLLLFYLHA